MNPLVTKRCSLIEEAIYQEGFQAGAASRDEEVDEFLRQLEDHRQAWKKFGEEQRQLRGQVKALRETLESLAIDLISDSDRIEIAVAAIKKAKGV